MRENGFPELDRSGAAIMTVSIATTPEVTTGTPARAFDLPWMPVFSGLPNFALSRSGAEILAIGEADAAAGTDPSCRC
jgi:hypothetical protein